MAQLFATDTYQYQQARIQRVIRYGPLTQAQTKMLEVLTKLEVGPGHCRAFLNDQQLAEQTGVPQHDAQRQLFYLMEMGLVRNSGFYSRAFGNAYWWTAHA